MNDEALNKLFLLYKQFVPGRKPNVNSQMCLFWSTKNPPDILENTKQLDAIEKAFDIYINEDEAVEMFDMNLLQASKYIQKLVQIDNN